MADSIDRVQAAQRLLEQVTPGMSHADAVVAVGAAQAYATLALAEQQRMANLIALGQFRIGPNEAPLFRHFVVEPTSDLDVAPVAEIREALGL